VRALVTGGGGFLGLYIVEQLCARGDRVRVLCRGHYPRLDELGVQTRAGDVRDAEAVADACAGIDTVFHVAAVPGIWGSWSRFYSTNTLGTENVLWACRQQRVGRMVLTSSPSVIHDGRAHVDADESLPYPETFLCHYPHTKMLAERAVLRACDDDLLTVALRPHLIWGPRDNHLIPRLIQRARSGRLRQVGDGSNEISMSYVENAAAAHLQAADALQPGGACCGQAYFVNEPQPVKLWGWINDLLSLAGLPPVSKRISAAAAWRLGAVLETAYDLLRIESEPPMTRFLAAQLSQSHSYRIGRAERDFGYRPVVAVEEGMQRVAPQLRALAERAADAAAE
jgi:2-alkyl-3-oxoalkanoate reductase